MRVMVTAAAAAMTALAMVPTAGAQADTADWTGGYIGVTGVYAFTSANAYNDYLANGNLIYTSEIDFDDIAGGARLGHNFSLGDGLIFGVETDIAVAGKDYARAPTLELGIPYPTEDLYNISNSWSARVRLGKPVGVLLPYLTGGITAARLRTGWDSTPADDIYGRGSRTAIGYTLGTGLEYAATPNLRFHAEYRFSDFGTTRVTVREYDGFTSDFDIDLHTHMIVFGASYAFGPRN
jgi:outer membrane immunogenic protein